MEATEAPEVSLVDDTSPADTALETALRPLRVKHPELVVLTVKGQPVAFRPITRVEYGRFRAQIADPKKRGDATETLVRSVVVYPDRVAFNAFLERYPAAAEAIGDEVIDDAGGVKVERR